MSSLFTERDIAEITARELAIEHAEEQIRALRERNSEIQLVRPCTIGAGITRIPTEEQDSLQAGGLKAAAQGRVTKFVPASGAASRMFKDLIGALETAGTRPSAKIPQFFQRLDDFPFATELRRVAGVTTNELTEDDERRLLRTLLFELGAASKPKGLIPFHQSVNGPRTAFEEQLREACGYAVAADGRCRVHFTVSPEFTADFQRELERVGPQLRAKHGCDVDVSFSVQHPSTDTLATDAAGEVFRTADGRLLFRPGGHGALIRNLQESDGDIVSIKNIDNILPAEMQGESIRWKSILIGLLACVQQEVFDELRSCAGDHTSERALDGAIAFAAERFGRHPRQPLDTIEAKKRFVLASLDRPIRICGVVRNEGEPGGAPFWTRESDGSESVQIVESSQVNFSDPAQEKLWQSSTHFNPVDVVCSLRRFNGEPFELSRFVDQRAVFVSRKSHEGRELFALELPGLWNGAMAHWNTICVEVPASTFAPVKTVLDLLRPQHQAR